MNLKIKLLSAYIFFLPGMLSGSTEAPEIKYDIEKSTERANKVNYDEIDLSKKDIKVGLQVGHWKTDELPAHLWTLRSSTGAQVNEYTEIDTNLKIAKLVKSKLEKAGIEVDLLPATVPTDYKADLFISIHADGSENKSKSGYKVGVPYRDATGLAEAFAVSIADEYGKEVPLEYDPNITGNMKGYYAFAWWRGGENTVSKETPSILIETGFLTNRYDREIIYHKSEKPAAGIARGVLKAFAASYINYEEIATKVAAKDYVF